MQWCVRQYILFPKSAASRVARIKAVFKATERKKEIETHVYQSFYFGMQREFPILRKFRFFSKEKSKPMKRIPL